jgi:hypothetical protein
MTLLQSLQMHFNTINIVTIHASAEKVFRTLVDMTTWEKIYPRTTQAHYVHGNSDSGVGGIIIEKYQALLYYVFEHHVIQSEVSDQGCHTWKVEGRISTSLTDVFPTRVRKIFGNMRSTIEYTVDPISTTECTFTRTQESLLLNPANIMDVLLYNLFGILFMYSVSSDVGIYQKLLSHLLQDSGLE